MFVDFYKTFNKAKNSTARPGSNDAYFHVEGILKDKCSIYEPIIKVNIDDFQATGDDVNIQRYNYCYISQFGRYYFVTDKIWDSGYWEFHLKCDVLGTWRTIIGSTEQMIERSGLPGIVDDPVYQPEITPNVQKISTQYLTDLFADQPSVLIGNWSDVGHGVYIVTMAGVPTDTGWFSTTAVVGNTYAMTKDQFDAFRTELSTTSYTGLDPTTDNISANTAKVLINPFQYIIRCFYLPLTKAQLFGTGYTDVRIRYGWYMLQATVTQVFSPLKQFTLYQDNIPRHPLASSQLVGLPRMFRTDRWTNYYLIWPMFGSIKIDSDLLLDGDKMLITAVLDIFSGEVSVQVSTFANTVSPTNYIKTIPIAHLSWAIDVPLSSYLRNPTANLDTAQQTTAFLPRLADAFMSGGVGGIVDTIYSGIKTTTSARARAMAADVQMVGSAGTFSPLAVPRYGFMFVYWNPTTVKADASLQYRGFVPKLGVLTMKRHTPAYVATLNNEPALIVCQKPVLIEDGGAANWSQVEYDEIIAYMSRGFYYV